MTHVGQPERATQNRVIALFRDELGYRYLNDWTEREGKLHAEVQGHSAQSGISQEATDAPGIHRRARIGAFA